MNPTHHIKTVKDFVDIATESNIDLLLTDFRNFIMLSKSNSGFITDPTTFQWIDDGKNDLIMDLTKNNWTKEEFDSVSDIIKTTSNYSEEYVDANNHNVSIHTKNVINGQLVFELPK